MTVKKLLQFIFCLGLFSVMVLAQNKVAKVDRGGQYVVLKTTVAPVIDGVQDPIWKNLDWNPLLSYDNNPATLPDDWTDLFGATKMMYDDDNIYILFFTQDSDPVGNDAAAVNWQRNGVEIYFDGDYTRDMSGVVSAPDHHLTFRHEHIDNETTRNFDVETGLDTTGLEWKFRDDDTMIGYWLEIKVPLDAIDMPNIPNSVFGLEFQQNDNDGNGRENVSKWWAQAGDSAWQYAGTWGTGILSDEVIDGRAIINKVPAASAPVVDGVLDNVFRNGHSYTTNNFGNISATTPVYPDDFSDAFVRLYMLYDDENLYGFFEVYDEDPVGNDAAAVNWQRNAVELYLDGDNTKDASGVVSLPDHHLTFRHEHIDNEATRNFDVETGLDTTGLEWKITDAVWQVGDFEVGGYTVEFKIPLDAVDMPNIAGSAIGLEIQQDDNDGNGRDVVTKWWENEGDSSWQYASSWGTAVLGGEVTVGVDREVPGVLSYRLEQNYPNPFNPSTKISYSVANSDHVKLTVYNVLGKEVAVLVNETQNAGQYSVNFNANNLSSGIYFYRLEAGNTMLVNKMVLLK